MLIEHCAGKFPLWLTPEQYAILPISDKYLDYAKQVQQTLAQQNIRGTIDSRTESIGKKIRDTELKKIPIMLIVGEKEADAQKVAVRLQGDGDKGAMSIDEFTSYFQTLLD